MEKHHSRRSVFSDPKALRIAFPDQYVFGIALKPTKNDAIGKIKVIWADRNRKAIIRSAKDFMTKNIGEKMVIMTTSPQKHKLSGIIFDAAKQS